MKGKRQTGFALLIFLLVMMGFGGIALTGVAQGVKKEVDKKRYEHNKEVLNRAKQALLMFSYNYPQTNSTPIGPGRLPCPDHDNNGLIGTVSISLCETVGRLPWNDLRLDTPEFIDANGERLWYAVSSEFRNSYPTDDGANSNGDDTVNSESLGTITLVDQTGSIIYDGAVSGIAAVIIAPGSVISRDNDNNGIYETPQLRATATQQNNPENYLDTFSGFDNSTFLDGFNALADGFILGPILETRQASPSVNTVVVNDQIVVITTEEIVAMAEKAVLSAYQNAINDYKANIGINRFPWLDPYESSDGLTSYDAVAQPLSSLEPIIGRVPSIFANYFVSNSAPWAQDSESIKPELLISLTIDNQNHNFTIPAAVIPSIYFKPNGDLVSSINNGFSIKRYFWDGHDVTPTPSSPDDDIWEVCPNISESENDCNRDVHGDFIGGTSSIVPLKVRLITINFIGSSPIVFDLVNMAGVIEHWVPPIPENPDINNHVYIAGTFITPIYVASISYDQADNFQSSFILTSSGTLNYGEGADDSLKVGLPYYPVLPIWVLDNGWHNSVLLAYSASVRPGGDGTCTVGIDCLTLRNFGGVTNNKLALLVQSGKDINGDIDTGLVDGLDDNANPPVNDSLGLSGGGADVFSNDLGDIFEGQNATSPFTGALIHQLTFEKPINGSGNDVILVLE
jgi:hypothetical protein